MPCGAPAESIANEAASLFHPSWSMINELYRPSWLISNVEAFAPALLPMPVCVMVIVLVSPVWPIQASLLTFCAAAGNAAPHF